MASFLAGDSPVADFDYDIPAAADSPGVTLTIAVEDQTLPATIIGTGLVGTWRGLTLPAAGMYPVLAAVTADGRTERALLDWLVVVDPDDQWHNVLTARLEWAGAPEADGTLARLLDVARDQVTAYAPAAIAIPERYRAAQLMQARNTWNASLTNADQQVDVGGFTVTVRPLDWAVKQLLRPLTATKAFG
jgi:hypothetical protein